MNILAMLSANELPVLSAAACALMILGFGWCCLALVRLHRLVRAERAGAQTARTEQEASLSALRQAVEGLAAQWREVHAPQQAPQAAVRNGLNLSKRSQALRLHRRGEPPERIAEQLAIPLQEVELLLKIHEIVMRAI